MGRLYGKLLKPRIELDVDETEEQSGLRAIRFYIDNIFRLQQIVEKKVRIWEIYVVFMDLKKRTMLFHL